ncbi:MAG: D-2-hydroxyacid dehydrogenase [Polyangiaceae bacterium]
MDRQSVVHVYVPHRAAARDAVEALVERAGHRVVRVDAAGVEEALPTIDILFAGEPPRVDWSRASRLRLLQLMGSGTESLWPATGLPDRVAIANARGIHLPEMRDHALALMLAIERELPRFFQQQRERVWRPVPPSTLAGKTVALLGLGEVGRSLVAPCAALGMRVVGARATGAPVEQVDRIYAVDEIPSMLEVADHLVVAVPLTPRSRGLLDARALARMKPSACVVQLSRGAVVDASALEAALRGGRLRAAALDVFDDEPLPPTSPLWSTPNLWITPHVGGLVPDYVERVVRLFLENLDLVERGLAPRTEVSRARGY